MMSLQDRIKKNYEQVRHPVVQKELRGLQEALADIEATRLKVARAAYNLERSFVENVKEISGTGWTAEEARERYGL